MRLRMTPLAWHRATPKLVTCGVQPTADKPRHRNNGARRATGLFLAFLDQDDLWKPTFLEETVPILQDHANAAVVHCDGYQVNEVSEILEYDGLLRASLRGQADQKKEIRLFSIQSHPLFTG